MKTIRVVLVDDHEVVRLGLMTLIDDQDDLQVVAEAGSTEEALAAVRDHQPHVVLMDIRLPGEGGIEATRKISERFPDSKVVILTSFADDQLVFDAIRAGAVGYVLKQVGNDEVLRAVRAAARGDSLLDPATTARVLGHVRHLDRQAEQDAFRMLSDRQVEVLVELAKGKSNSEIGLALNLSEKTVRNYVSAILQKLDLNNRVELATYAVEHRLFDHYGRQE
ncbi:MAG TPA: response regulator transcription factor [Anaerolineales bacterium]|jgi:DNA-binding NarL/FixJ family response regulator